MTSRGVDDSHSRAEVVAAYMDEIGRAPEDADWARWHVGDLLYAGQYDEVFAIVVDCTKVITDRSLLASIAAGPLEDVFKRAGAAYVDRAEAEARANPRFAYALTVVRGVDEPIQGRLWALANEVLGTSRDRPM